MLNDNRLRQCAEVDGALATATFVNIGGRFCQSSLHLARRGNGLSPCTKFVGGCC